uniref:Sulfatase n=1 Tax=uncultured bacterium 5H7 TaxID=1701327 RepID=A0A0N9HMZ5_9BACT|nr:sulfatase [uncultured bacterium 5H7]
MGKLARLLRPGVVVPAVVCATSAVELAIADRKYGTFTGGFGQANAVDTPGECLLFAAGYLVAQTALALAVYGLCVWANRRRAAWAASFHFTFLFGGMTLGALIAAYQLHSYFSDAVDFALLKQLGGGSFKDALLFGKNEILAALAAALGFGAVWWGLWRLARRLIGTDGTPARPPRRKAMAAAWLIWLALLALIPRAGSDAALGLDRMLGWGTLEGIAAVATDFDGDGYGLIGNRIDAHPFDAARHPLALDVPGNGIDEDEYAGDLALVPVPAPRSFTLVPAQGANVVIVVMESTRGDVLGKRIDGHPVAPNLEAIAAAGAAVAPAYSHVGFTTASLKSIFAGSLAPRPGDPSLFAELKRSGYGIGVFSGQPEDFGDISATVGMRTNADVFVDAEQLKDRRSSQFAAQGSLLIDEGVLLGEFDRHFGKPDAWAKPQFLYFNFQSPHFPYDHAGVEHRFAHPPLARGAIAAERREEVARTYWNAVAHSDAALGALVARLKALGQWDNTIMLVTGDHGESLFEDGFLGHGHLINRRQFATFLAVNRPLPGIAPPLAISDYRGILLDLLAGRAPRRDALAPFMHVGELDHPSTIGMAGSAFGIVSLRLDRGEVCFERSARCASYSGLTGAERRAADAVVARWGSERWAARR